MWGWIITVAAVAVLTVLCDIILPDGKTQKYIKTVMGVVVTFVVIQPLIGLFDRNITVSDLSSDNLQIQNRYIQNINERQNAIKVRYLTADLQYKGLTVNSIELSEKDKVITVKFDAERTERHEKDTVLCVRKYFEEYQIKTFWKGT